MPGVVNKQGIDATVMKMELDVPHLAAHVRCFHRKRRPLILLPFSVFGAYVLPAIVDVVPRGLERGKG